ncbi:MAG: diguanylate cyclase [Lachnospiraceae bacterium]|nr:diguanylate cyclase [Lachnospiraceae bacterium]
MTDGKDNSNKRFVYTAVIGSAVVMIILTLCTFWASRKTISTTNEAVSAVSSFYLQAMADQRAKTIVNLINNNFEHMEKALTFIEEENVGSQEDLRKLIGEIKTLLSLNRFALVDEDNIVYTQYTTFTGGSRYDFLTAQKLDERVINTVYQYGSSKQLCLAIPANGVTVMGKPLKACFVQIDIDEITDLLEFKDQERTYFGLYVKNGGNLSDTDLGHISAGENLLDNTKDYLSEKSWERLCTDFKEENEGSLTLVSEGVQEELCYVPVPYTGWMMAVLIRESIIEQQIHGISESNRLISRVLTTVAVISMLLFAVALILQLRKTSKEKLEAEKETSKMFRNMANIDSLTGVRNKHAFSDYERMINGKIQEEGKREKIAVLVCDVNGLKHVNDTKGHAAGDQLIKDATALICEHFVHGAVFRIGGDEFAVVLQEKGFDTMEETLASINREVEENISKDKVVISIGYSVLKEEDTQLHDVFERADQMMYERKKELKAMGAKTRSD